MPENAPVPAAAVAAWARRVRNNLLDWKSGKKGTSNAGKLEFIRRQYALLALINRALDGKVRFTGADWSARDNDLL